MAYLTNLFESLIVVEEESKILKRNVDLAIATLRSMLFQRIFASTERVFIDLEQSKSFWRETRTS